MKKLLQISMAALIGASVLSGPAMAGGWGHGWGGKGHHYGYKYRGYKRHYGYKHGYYHDKCWKWVKYYYGWKKVYYSC